MRKLEDFRDETSEDLKERPDAAKFADIIAGLRLQIRDTDERVGKLGDGYTYTLNEHTHSIDQMKMRLSNVFKELERRLTRDDEARMMAVVRKLPQYSDFEDLYKKTVPVCARFEKRVFAQTVDIDQLRAIVEQFDGNLTLKASAHEVKELWAHCAATYSDKEAQEQFIAAADRKMEQVSAEIAEKIHQFDANVETLERHIKVQLKNAKAALMPSAFEEGNENSLASSPRIGG